MKINFKKFWILNKLKIINENIIYDKRKNKVLELFVIEIFDNNWKMWKRKKTEVD